MTVYVRWYGKVLEGELLDGESMGMKQVRIPLDGHHPIALFTPGHVYETAEQVGATHSEISEKRSEISENCSKIAENVPECSQIVPKAVIADIMPGYDRLGIEAFKEAYWDHERGHLRIDKLDEFYQLWRMALTPFGYVEAEAPVTLPSHKPELMLVEAVHEPCTPVQQHQSQKPVSPKPSKKMLRSTGQQQFNDSTQLALFD